MPSALTEAAHELLVEPELGRAPRLGALSGAQDQAAVAAAREQDEGEWRVEGIVD